MPVTKYKLYSLYINNVQIDTNHISSFQITLEQDPNNATLPVGVCEIGIKNNSSYTFSEHNKIVVTFSCSVSGTSNIIYNFYISKIDRSNDKEIAISGVDYIGLLDESNFEKAYKTPTAALSIISDILYDINGTYLSRISSDVNLTPVFEKMTKRQALQHVLFATGYRIRTNANQGNYDLEIYPESYESTAITVDDSVVYRGSSLVKNNEVNGVSITSHDYKLDDFGTVVVGEERFKDKSKVRNLSRISDIENIITVSGAVCIQETRLNDVALRIYNDYQRYQDLNFDYVWCGEHIGKKLTIEAEDGMHTGFLKKLFLDVGLLSVVASGSMVLPNNNIVSPTETETQSITSTGSVSNEVTYSELVDLIAEHKLVPGAKYTITDYVTKIDGNQGHSTLSDARSTEHPFKLMVEALTNTLLSEDAKAIKNDNDSYFSSSNLTNWKIKYDISNNKSKYLWADTNNGKGVIYEMIDEYGNKAPYDFKNIQFKRYKITSVNNNMVQSGVVGQYHASRMTWWNNDPNRLENDTLYPELGVVNIDTTDFIWKYTFDRHGNDHSLSGKVANAVIEPTSYDNKNQILNNIVLSIDTNRVYDDVDISNVIFDRGCFAISIGRKTLGQAQDSYPKIMDTHFYAGTSDIILNGGVQMTEMRSCTRLIVSGWNNTNQYHPVVTNTNFWSAGRIYGQFYNDCEFFGASQICCKGTASECVFKATYKIIISSSARLVTVEGNQNGTLTIEGTSESGNTSAYIHPNAYHDNWYDEDRTITLNFTGNVSHVDVYMSSIVYK